MKIIAMVVAAGLSAAFVAGAYAQSGVRRLDLTRPELPRSRVPVSGTLQGMSGVPAPASPFSVRLLSTDHQSYRRGDPIVYEIEIANAAPAPVALPVSLDHQSFAHLDHPPSLRIVLDGVAAGRTEPIAAISLVGSSTMSGSLQTLAPGEHLVIRIPGEIFRQSSKTPEQTGEYQVRARVEFDDATNTFAPTVSSNALALRLDRSR